MEKLAAALKKFFGASYDDDGHVHDSTKEQHALAIKNLTIEQTKELNLYMKP